MDSSTNSENSYAKIPSPADEGTDSVPGTSSTENKTPVSDKSTDSVPGTSSTKNQIPAKDNPKLEIVQDDEWKTIKNGDLFYELLPKPTDAGQNKESEGVIDPSPKYAAMYQLAIDIKVVVEADLPNASNPLYKRVLSPEYKVDTIVQWVATGVYNLAHEELCNQYPANTAPSALIIACPEIWQGKSAIAAGIQMLKDRFDISILLVEPTDSESSVLTDEFISKGGTLHKKMEEIMPDVKFDVVVVAFENQSSGRRSNLHLYGNWLKYAKIIFVDPPVLKCSYMEAITLVTGEDYIEVKRPMVLVPFMPKPYVPDEEEIYAVSCDIDHYVQKTAGIKKPIFPRLSFGPLQMVKPVSSGMGVVRKSSPGEDLLKSVDEEHFK